MAGLQKLDIVLSSASGLLNRIYHEPKRVF